MIQHACATTGWCSDLSSSSKGFHNFRIAMLLALSINSMSCHQIPAQSWRVEKLTISKSSSACTRSSMLFAVSSAIAIFSFMIKLSLLPRI